MQVSASTQTAQAAQAVQAAKATQTNLQNITNVSTSVTSTNPAALQSQIGQLSSAITQLQSHGGSANQIQKLQQAMQTAKSQILKREQSAEAEKASEQSANIQAAAKKNGGLNIQA